MNPSKIIGIQFSILSPEEIRKSSVAEITSRDTYVNNKPVINGLFDPRMGVLEQGLICPTDGLNYIQTPGYFGHIELARPVYYVQYMDHIIKILRCVCFKCSKLLMNKDKYKHILDMPPKKRWEFVLDHLPKTRRCGDENDEGCGCLNPTKITNEGFANIVAEWAKLENMEDDKTTLSMKLSAEIVLKIFRRISDEDIAFMGFSPTFSRPEWMICQVLAVPPPAVRPSVKMDAQQRSEDDITHIIVDIIKKNKTLQEKIEKNAKQDEIDNWTLLLQYFVATLVNNKLPGANPATQRSGRPLKSISERLNGKTGRVRGNLMGKRVDYSARSVIGGDPNLGVRELGVPMKIAMNITYPVYVNERNKNSLMKLVRNGPDVYPGAKILERRSGESISLRYVDRESIDLNIGDVVHRHMMNGDAVLFNRQPTLHKMSMQCHIVRVMREGNTFRFNLAATKGYNADFDGDEMNMHMPQDDIASAELRNLATVPRQIVSPANNDAIVGIFQDNLLGIYRFTRPDIEFTPRKAMNLLMAYPNIQKSLFGNPERPITNFDILSQILPPLSAMFENGLRKDGEDKKTSNNVIEIINGQMVRGNLNKSIKKLIHSIFNDFGFNASADFIDNIQNIVTEYMKMSAFSVGISDLIADKETNMKIADAITRKKQEVKDILDQIHLGAFENNSGKSNEEEFESVVNSILNKAREEAGKIGRNSLDKNNRFVVMVNAGSKGSDVNIAQMISCLGQQNVDGKRISYGFEDRTLPHFTKFDDTPEARGFVENSFIQGLTPQELFFHAMGGREGLIDTAVKTSETGYIQRQLIKSMEDLKVEYDMTVRNNMGKIIQFQYGDDSFETTKVEGQSIPLMKMTTEEIYAHYMMPDDELEDQIYTTNYTSDALQRMKTQKDELKKITKQYIDSMLSYRDILVEKVFKYQYNENVNVPVNFKRIINNVKHQLNIQPNSMVDITPFECFTMIQYALEQMRSIRAVKLNSLFIALYMYYMSPKELLMVHRFNRNGLTYLTNVLLTNYKRAIVAPGDMVGMVAAQSIGEPTTQLTLNSVTYETEIPVRDAKGHMQNIQIGEFVNTYINSCIGKKEYYEDKDTTYAELDRESQYYEILAPTEEGEMKWCRIEAVTKHPVVNEDGTNTMLKITTENGREVTVTKAKSLLKLVDGRLVASTGAEAKVGDYVPVNTMPYEHTEITTLNLKDVLLPSEYLFMSEVEKALTYKNETFWWKKHNGVDFVLPYKRSDAFLDMVNRNILQTKKKNGTNTSVIFKPGNVYMKHNSRTATQIPECLPLDYDFGYFIGAYCAEGCVTKTQISIANNDINYLIPIKKFCEKYNITYKIYKTDNKNQPGWTTQDIRIYSKLLTEIIIVLCNKISHTKYLSDIIVYSNNECKKGFLDAYIGGDGSVSKKSNHIIMYSTSKNLLNKVQCILNTFGIYSYIRKYKKQENNNRGTKIIHQVYNLLVLNENCKKLAKLLNIKIDYKNNECLNKISNTYKYKHNQFQDSYLPNYNSRTETIENIKREPTSFQHILFEKIQSIEEVSNTTDYAYDLTVEETRNFIIVNGLALRDTFHHSGISSKSSVTRGVPRIKEILSLTEKPKIPSISVYLKDEDQYNKLKAQQVMYLLEHTSLRDIVESVSICFDPDNLNTLIEEDKALMAQYHEFETIAKECDGVNVEDEGKRKSKWIIRFVFDKEAMLDKNITMDDVHFAISTGYKDDVECVYSDFNEDKLVFRIRLRDLLSKSMGLSKQHGLDQSDEIYVLQNVQENMLDNIVLKGIKNISKVLMRKLQDNVVNIQGNYVRKEAWMLDTIGSNLMDLLANEDIDFTRTYSNDIIEMYNVLGIEAARQVIYNEMMDVMDGTYINYHHLSLLCDRMCANAKLVSTTRHGINNDNIGPIAKATFEETPEMFLRAARHADFDNMRGVSANVMCGQLGNYGTSAFQVVLDVQEMMKLGNKVLEKKEDVEEMFDVVDRDDPCSISNIKTVTNVEVIQGKNTGEDNDYSIF